MLNDTITPSPTWVINSLVSYGYWREASALTDFGQLTAASIGLSPALFQAPVLPNITADNYTQLSTNLNYADYHYARDTSTALVNVTKELSKHTLKFGGDFDVQQISNFKDYPGNFSFSNSLTSCDPQASGPCLATNQQSSYSGNAIASELLGTASSGGQGIGIDAAMTIHIFGVYIQDQWRVTPMPGSARDVVLARAARLEPKARETLEAAALIGGTVDERLLRHVVADPALAEVIASGLVSGHPVLCFRHEIARQAIEQSVVPARRSGLHARILQGLRNLGCDDDARLAFHAEEAGDGPAALEHAALAGRRARALASHREAARQFERALRFADGEGPASVAARWIELATELSMIDRWPDTENAYTRALENWRAAGDPLGEGDTLRRMCSALWRLCRGDQILAVAEAAVAILEPLGPTAELAAAYGNLAAFQNEPGRLDVVVPLAQRAQELAVRFGVPAVQSRAATTEAQARWLAGDDWEPVLRGALSIALENGLEPEAGFAYTNLHELHCGNREYAQADQFFLNGVGYCEDHDLLTYYTCLRGVRTSTLERLGRWDESARLAEAVLAAIASPVNRMIPMTSLAKVAARRGDPEVWPHLDAAMTAADGTTQAEYIGPVRLARAEARWLEGDPAAARQEAELADDAFTDVTHPWLNGEIAVWLRRTGSPRTSQRELAEPYRLQLTGDHRGAAELFDALGCPYDAALALFDAPDELSLRRALDICHALGAVATARIIRQRMRSLGIRSVPAGQRAATREHPLGLTQREQEVLDLLCEGRTNASIAVKLVISPKTVDHHVSSVLAKLGVSKRTEVATARRAAATPE